MNIKLIIDSREPEKFIKLFENKDIQVTRQFLLVGDIVSGNICIERKAIGDWANSVKGHIWEQLKNQNENYMYNYLIIVGKFVDLYWQGVKAFTIEMHLGALASISENYKTIKILQVDNDTQYIALVKKIIEKHNNPVKHVVIEKLSNEDDVYTRMLRQISGVGQKRAIEILEKFKFQELSKLSVEELKSVVGEKTAQSIKKWLF